MHMGLTSVQVRLWFLVVPVILHVRILIYINDRHTPVKTIFLHARHTAPGIPHACQGCMLTKYYCATYSIAIQFKYHTSEGIIVMI